MPKNVLRTILCSEWNLNKFAGFHHICLKVHILYSKHFNTTFDPNQKLCCMIFKWCCDNWSHSWFLSNFQKFILDLVVRGVICKDLVRSPTISSSREYYLSLCINYSTILHQSTLIFWNVNGLEDFRLHSVLLLPRLNKKYLYQNLTSLLTIFGQLKLNVWQHGLQKWNEKKFEKGSFLRSWMSDLW